MGVTSGPSQHLGQKIGYSKDKKLVFFTFIFALLTPDGGRGVSKGGRVMDVIKVSTEVLVQYVNSRSRIIEVTQFKGSS